MSAWEKNESTCLLCSMELIECLISFSMELYDEVVNEVESKGSLEDASLWTKYNPRFWFTYKWLVLVSFSMGRIIASESRLTHEGESIIWGDLGTNSRRWLTNSCWISSTGRDSISTWSSIYPIPTRCMIGLGVGPLDPFPCKHSSSTELFTTGISLGNES